MIASRRARLVTVGARPRRRWPAVVWSAAIRDAQVAIYRNGELFAAEVPALVGTVARVLELCPATRDRRFRVAARLLR